MQKGYIQVYTGNGKGKTTAALGLCLRAVCSGKKIFFAQMLKGMYTSELEAAKFLPGFDIKQYGKDQFIYKVQEKDVKMAEEALSEIKYKMLSQKYDIIVIDEINVAVYLGILKVDKVLDLMEDKPQNVELVLTGANADKRIIEKADLVTNMDMLKHYYQKNVKARPGIEY